MGFQQYLVQEWDSIPKTSTVTEKIPACFDCSICLDFAIDPVVTLCGHLFCWPCMYKWFDSQTLSLSSEVRPQCPVCKAEISEKTLVPLYGRGQSISKSESKVIPPRPPACGIKGLTELFNPEEQRNSHQDPYPSVAPPTVGMFGEMVYARVFGNSQSLYTYPNSYHSVISRTPRLRRLEFEADKSLHRVTVFLFCFSFCAFLYSDHLRIIVLPSLCRLYSL